MSVPNLSEAVAAALARLKALEQSPMSPTKEEELPALNSELRNLHKLVCDKINALPWNEERKQLMIWRKKLDRALSSWEYESQVDISSKRLNEVDKELSRPLNNSKRREFLKERRRISALRKKLVQQAGTAGVPKSEVPAVKSTVEGIAEYEALRARAFGFRKDEC
jgi:hypothetical protein